MVTVRVKKNVTDGVTKWKEALSDAQQQLEKAQKDISGWKGVIQICRKRIAEGATWPGDSVHEQQH